MASQRPSDRTLSSTLASLLRLAASRVAGRLCFLLLALSPALALADTTWVSGAVSGTWTVEGSPYVITDSVWVPSGGTLIVNGGVEVLLPDSTSRFNLGGVCRFEGTEADSVRINLQHPFSKLRSSNAVPAHFIAYDYCEFVGAGSHALVRGDSISIAHSAFRLATGHTTSCAGNAITVSGCRLQALATYDADVHISNTVFTQSIFVHDGAGQIDHVAWVSSEEDSLPGAIIFMQIFRGGDITVTDCSAGSLSADVAYFPGSAVTVQQCKFVYVELGGSQDVLVQHSAVDRFNLGDCQGLITRCVFRAPNIVGSSQLTFLRNTFFRDDSLWNGNDQQYFLHTGGTTTLNLRSNIFYSRMFASGVATPNSAAITPPPSYNLVWGMEDPWRGLPLGPGNVLADPLFDPDSSDHALQYPSPAINAGDPALQHDPDGSRADIGARYWDHRVDHPPVIGTPRVIRTGWGNPLTLDLWASDERAIQVGLVGHYPRWLQAPNRLDDIVNHRLFQGRVPYGSSSFPLIAVARDDAGHVVQDTIQIEIYPASTLSDTVTGILTAEYSPYIALDDVYIPAGDTLAIEPGVHMQFDSPDHLSWLTVAGTLTANGTAQDSVWIESRGDELWNGLWLHHPTCTVDLRYCFFGGALRNVESDSIGRFTLDHCTVRGPGNYSYGFIVLRSHTDSLIFTNCRFEHGLNLWMGGRFRLEGCEFNGLGETSFCGVDALEGSEGIIRGCVYAEAHSNLGGDSKITVERCLFQQGTGRAITTNGTQEGRRFLIRNNTCVGLGGFVGFYMQGQGDTMSVVNNTIAGSTWTGIGLPEYLDTTRFFVSHNCFWQNHQIFSGDSLWPSLGLLATTNLNGDSTDLYGNLFMDPLFADTVEYHLSAESPCIDAGVDVGSPFVGQAPDIGWWEYGASAVPQRETQTAGSPSVVIYPNPTNGAAILTLNLPEGVKAERVRIFNVLGREVAAMSLREHTVSMSVALPIGELASGIYFVKVESKGQTLKAVKVMVLK